MNLFTANKLSLLRKNAGMSQEVLAEKIGVSRQSISKWERGEASPDTYNLQQLSNLYNTSIDDLIGDKNADKIIESINKSSCESTPKNNSKVFFNKINCLFVNKQKQLRNNNKQKSDRINASVAKILLKIPFPILIIIIFLLIGFATKTWHPTWILLLTIPMYYMTALAFFSRSKRGFFYILPIPIIIISVYLLIGFSYNLWHPYWIYLFSVPLYFWAVSFFIKKKN